MTLERKADLEEFNSSVGVRLHNARECYHTAKGMWFNRREKAKRTADLLLMIDIADAELLDFPIAYTAVLARLIGRCEAELRQNGDL